MLNVNTNGSYSKTLLYEEHKVGFFSCRAWNQTVLLEDVYWSRITLTYAREESREVTQESSSLSTSLPQDHPSLYLLSPVCSVAISIQSTDIDSVKTGPQITEEQSSVKNEMPQDPSFTSGSPLSTTEALEIS